MSSSEARKKSQKNVQKKDQKLQSQFHLHLSHCCTSVSPPNLKKWRCYSLASFVSARLFHPWKRDKSPAFHASRSPGVLRSQSGRISLVTTRRSCQRSLIEGRPQNQ